MSDAIFPTIRLKKLKFIIKKWTWTLIIVYRGRVEVGTGHVQIQLIQDRIQNKNDLNVSLAQIWKYVTT